MMSNAGLPENRALIDKFLDYCRVQGKSRKTVACHKQALSAVANYLRKPFQLATNGDWREALGCAAEERNWARSSIRQANSSVRMLYRWMADTGIADTVVANRKLGDSGRPQKTMIPDRIRFEGTEDPNQIFMYHGKPVSALAVAALRLAMGDGFLYRVVMSDSERAVARTRDRKSSKRQRKEI